MFDTNTWPECIVCGIKRRSGYCNLPVSANVLVIQDELNINLADIIDPDFDEHEKRDAFLRKYCSLKCFKQHLKLAQKKSKERIYSRSNQCHPSQEEFPQDKLRQILIEEEGYCRVCGDNRVLELHHIIPQEFGGKTTKGNCVLLCPTCHALTRGQGFINK